MPYRYIFKWSDGRNQTEIAEVHDGLLPNLGDVVDLEIAYEKVRGRVSGIRREKGHHLRGAATISVDHVHLEQIPRDRP